MIEKRYEMIKSGNANIDKWIKYSRYYLILSSLIFLIAGDLSYGFVMQRLIVLFFMLVAYYLFYHFAGILMKAQRNIHKHHWGKAKKSLDFQLNFFILFFSLAIILFSFGDIRNFERTKILLVFMNIPVGLILGVIKAKKQISDSEAAKP